MLSSLKSISAAFWNPEVWLPPNTTWNDMKPTPENGLPDYRHLFLPLPFALALIVLRYFCERYFFEPFGKSLGIRSTRPKPASPNVILEKAYIGLHTNFNHKEIVALSKQLDWSERQVERWLRLRKSQDKPTTLKKFCENSWRCSYYLFSFIFGLIAMWDKPWLWNINNCFIDYPYHAVDGQIWWYYIISMSFYWSLNISQFFDNKRKDFWQMLVHHIAAIALLYFSWVCNFIRIGSLVLLVHDCADIFLEATKMANYASYQKVCDTMLGVFVFTWIITRLGIYPFWIIRSTSITAPNILPMFSAYYIFNSLLILLLVLHVVWTYFILKVAIHALGAGKMEGDVRSDSSDVPSDPITETPSNANHNHESKEK